MLHKTIAQILKDHLPPESTRLVKVELSKQVLNIIRKDDYLKNQLVLQGGNALHLVYNSPRLSEDLDFILKQDSDSFGEVLKIKQVIEDVVRDEHITVLVQKDTDSFKRIKLYLATGMHTLAFSVEIFETPQP